MAKSINFKEINKKLDMLSKGLDSLFTQTYLSTTQNRDDANKVYDKIDNTINRIITNNPNNKTIPGISRLLTHSNNTSIMNNNNEFSLDIFDNVTNQKAMNKVLLEYEKNKSLDFLDREIDIILKYMPKLERAIRIKVDNILSADNFSKDYLSISVQSVVDPQTTNANIESFKTKYGISRNEDELVEEICIRGEVWYYVVPYNIAFNKLLQTKNNYPYNINHEMTIFENGKITSDFSKYGSFSSIINNDVNNKCKLTISFNKSGILESAINEITSIDKANTIIYEDCKVTNFYETFTESLLPNNKNKPIKFDKTIPDNLEYEPIVDGITNNKDKKSKNNNKGKVNIPGAIRRKLERKRVIPIWIDDVWLGAFYVEISTKDNITTPSSMKSNSLLNNMCYSCSPNSTKSSQLDDDFIFQLASSISKFIDANFINNNTDISKELFTILKYNDILNSSKTQSAHMNISFIPADDLHHFYFKLDPKTHRGISDLEMCRIPAKLWITLNMCFSHGILTRGMDKRVFYVKQTVDTNVAQSLMNVLVQIKKGNFGIRQMDDLNNILGYIGQFNDYIIPTGADGPPVNMEVMNGQQFNIDDNFLTGIEENAIDPTGVPLELVNTSKSMDYAIHYTMSNSIFLKNVYKRQSIFQTQYSPMCTKLYNYEFNDNAIIKIKLSAPIFLSMTNGGTLIENATRYVESIISFENSNESEEVIAIYKRKLFRYILSSHLDTVTLDKLLEESKMEASLIVNNNNEE